LGANSWEEIKSHSFFKLYEFDWLALEKKEMKSPLKEILEKVHLKSSADFKGDTDNLFTIAEVFVSAH
jgi:hypothetical protein